MVSNNTRPRDISERGEYERFRDSGLKGKILHVLGGEKLLGEQRLKTELLAHLIGEELDQDPTLKVLGKTSYDNKITLEAKLDSKTVKVTVGFDDTRSATVEIPVNKLVIPMQMFPEQIVALIDPEAAKAAGINSVTDILKGVR